jgi:hypothetical protein
MTPAGRPDVSWLGDAELRLPAGLVLSFQRYELPASRIIERAPPSLGALPVGLSREGELLLPLASRECFWIGLTSDRGQPASLSIGLERDDGSIVDVLTGAAWDPGAAARAPVPGSSLIDGVRRADGSFEALFRDDGSACGPRAQRLHVIVYAGGASVAPVVARLELVDYATFRARSGSVPPAPLDPEAGYKGWLLP